MARRAGRPGRPRMECPTMTRLELRNGSAAQAGFGTLFSTAAALTSPVQGQLGRRLLRRRGAARPAWRERARPRARHLAALAGARPAAARSCAQLDDYMLRDIGHHPRRGAGRGREGRSGAAERRTRRATMSNRLEHEFPAVRWRAALRRGDRSRAACARRWCAAGACRARRSGAALRRCRRASPARSRAFIRCGAYGIAKRRARAATAGPRPRLGA